MCVQPEMFVGGLASEGVEANWFLRQIDIGADQAVDPERAGIARVSEDFDLAVGVGFSAEDYGAFPRLPEVQSPVLGKGRRAGASSMRTA